MENNKSITNENIELRDFFASQAMMAVTLETQEVIVASFWDWIKHLLFTHGVSFLKVKYIEVEDCYKNSSKRAYKYADAMIIARNDKQNEEQIKKSNNLFDKMSSL